MVNKNRKNVSYLYPNFNFKMKKSIENYKKKYGKKHKSYWDINENLIH